MVKCQSPETRYVLLVAATFASFGTGLAGEGEGAEPEAFVDTSAFASPDAREVIIDVPSALHWSRYQQGTLDDFTYTIYPDGSAKVMSGKGRLVEVARINCVSGAACTVAMTSGATFDVPVGQGLRPERPETFEPESAARYIARWILTGTAPEIIEIEESAPPEIVAEPAVPATEAYSSSSPVPVILAENTAPAEASNTANADLDVPQSATDEQATGTDLSEGEEASPESSEALDILSDTSEADQNIVEGTTEVQPAPTTNVGCDDFDPFFPDLCTGPKSEQDAEPEVVTRPIIETRTDAPAEVAAQPPSRSVQQGQVPSPATTSPPEPRQTPPEKDGWTLSDLQCSVTASASLAFIDGGEAKPRVSLGCGTRITERLSFRGGLVGYAIPAHKKDWDPDFTYAFNYKVNDRINLSYSNYSARFSDGDGPLAGLLDGNLRSSLKLPDIPLPNDGVLPCSASVAWPNPIESSLNLSCSYSVTPDLRLGATAYLYPPGVQGEFSPDYSYTASYRINDKWRLTYNNYSNNRWPWNRGDSPGPGLTGGSLSLTHQIRF